MNRRRFFRRYGPALSAALTAVLLLAALLLASSAQGAGGYPGESADCGADTQAGAALI